MGEKIEIRDLSSDRLRLRVFGPQDETLLMDLDSDPAVMTYINGGQPSTLEQVQGAVSRITKAMAEYPGFGNWILYTKDTNEFVGWVMLRPLAQFNEIEIGYRLKKKFWGRGFATEASRAVLVYAHEELKLTKVFAITHPDNKASQNVLRKIGMTFEGVRDYNPVIFTNGCDVIKVNYYILSPIFARV